MHTIMPLVSRPTATPALVLVGLERLPLLVVVGRMELVRVLLGTTDDPPLDTLVPLPPLLTVPLVVLSY
jgi:hypothetical protein